MENVVKNLYAEGHGRILVVDPPPEAGPLTDAFESVGLTISDEPKGGYTFILVFTTGLDDAKAKVANTVGCLSGDGLYWLAYPKGTSKRYKADINRDSSWDVLEPYGLRPVAQVALDDDWSALRFRRQEYSK